MFDSGLTSLLNRVWKTPLVESNDRQVAAAAIMINIKSGHPFAKRDVTMTNSSRQDIVFDSLILTMIVSTNVGLSML